MSFRIKRTVIILMISLITLPFIMLTDLFPFMRFGMFAEPVRHQIQKEYFEVVIQSEGEKEVILNPKLIGIEKHFFEYISRNYFYRNEGELLLKKIYTLLPAKKTEALQLKRYSDFNSPADSVITYKVR